MNLKTKKKCTKEKKNNLQILKMHGDQECINKEQDKKYFKDY